MQHIFEVIEHQTLRGKLLEEHPLLLVGADFNKAALKVTRANLIKADIWAKVIWGDIGRPDLLANDFYGDVSLWWIIASANALPGDSLYPPVGMQLRIPTDVQSVISQYKIVNSKRQYGRF